MTRLEFDSGLRMVREYLVTMTGTVTEAIQACTFPGAARQPVGTEMGIDTCTPMGKAMAHIAVVFAELERDLIRMRTYPRAAAGQGVERRQDRRRTSGPLFSQSRTS